MTYQEKLILKIKMIWLGFIKKLRSFKIKLDALSATKMKNKLFYHAVTCFANNVQKKILRLEIENVPMIT